MGTVQTAYSRQVVTAVVPPTEGTVAVKLTVTLTPANYNYNQTFDFSVLNITQVMAIKIYNPDPMLPLTMISGINQVPYIIPAGGGATVTTESQFGSFQMALSYPSPPAAPDQIVFLLLNYPAQPANWAPVVQTTTGSVTPDINATQAGTWTVGVDNFPASQAVTGTFWQTTQPISGSVSAAQSGTWTVGVNNFPASQAVTGTFWQTTQPISIAPAAATWADHSIAIPASSTTVISANAARKNLWCQVSNAAPVGSIVYLSITANAATLTPGAGNACIELMPGDSFTLNSYPQVGTAAVKIIGNSIASGSGAFFIAWELS